MTGPVSPPGEAGVAMPVQPARPAAVSATSPPTVSLTGNPTTTIVPMRPRYKLLLFFAFIFAFWVAMMVVMYMGTVYPQRHPAAPLPKASLPSSDAAPPNNPAR